MFTIKRNETTLMIGGNRPKGDAHRLGWGSRSASFGAGKGSLRIIGLGPLFITIVVAPQALPQSFVNRLEDDGTNLVG